MRRPWRTRTAKPNTTAQAPVGLPDIIRPLMERTLAIVKPDAFASDHTGAIISRIEQAGFGIRALRLVHLTRSEAEGFYAVHRDKPFFGQLADFMSSGPAVVMALEAPDAIKKWRNLMGPRIPRRPTPARSGRISAPPSSGTPRTALMRRTRRRSSSATSFPASTWCERARRGHGQTAHRDRSGGGRSRRADDPWRSPRPAAGRHVVRRGSFTFYAPITTSILISLLFTLLLSFWRR